MPDSKLADSEVYHTSNRAPLSPVDHLEHRAPRVMVLFHDKRGILPFSIIEYIKHLPPVLHVDHFRGVLESAWSESKRNRVEEFRAHWLHSVVLGSNASTTVSCCDTLYQTPDIPSCGFHSPFGMPLKKYC